MFTDNFIKAQKEIFMNVSQSYKYADGTSGDPSYIPTAMIQIGEILKLAKCGDPTSDISTSAVYFGTGSTPATKNDYTLEAPITSGISFVSIGTPVLGKVREGEFCCWNTYVVKNTTSEAINIYEIGLFASIQTGSTSPKYAKCLGERTVLTEPIVLVAGDEKIITYKITFNQTLNVE